MKPLLPPISVSPFLFDPETGEPRYSKSDEEMEEIARTRAAERLTAVLDVIKRAGPAASGILERPDGAGELLQLAAHFHEAEQGRVHLECAVRDENSVGGPLRSVPRPPHD